MEDSCVRIVIDFFLLKEEKLNIVYYSTEIDRNEQPDEMERILDSIGVIEVPTIVEINRHLCIDTNNNQRARRGVIMGRENEIEKLNDFYYRLPTLGVVASIGISLMGFIRKVPWSFEIIVWNCSPLIINFLFYSLFCLQKKQSKLQIKKGKLVSILLFLILIALNICLYIGTNVKQIDISSRDLKKINESKSQYNVVFGSDPILLEKKIEENPIIVQYRNGQEKKIVRSV